jgi:hypothetical protein
VGDWLNNLPAELGYALASAIVLGWIVAQIRGDKQLERQPTKITPRVLPPAPQRFVNRADEIAVWMVCAPHRSRFRTRRRGREQDARCREERDRQPLGPQQPRALPRWRPHR